MGMSTFRNKGVMIGIMAVVMVLVLAGAVEFYYGQVVNLHPASAHGLGISRRKMFEAVRSDFSSIGRVPDSTGETYIGYSAPDYLSTLILKGSEEDLTSVMLIDRFSSNNNDNDLALRRVEQIGRVIDPRATRWMVFTLNNIKTNWMRESFRDSTIIDDRKFLVATGVMDGNSSLVLVASRVQ